MSRVFLGVESRLGRRVVIKVLPPEMAAGVSAERFEREIQLAARLQHPHIVPVLTAGASEDLLYYVMPYIEGESLRAKLSREGELPVSETLRILRGVLDALAYAHEHGVVHRDIKPDNVLLSGKHAVVTDFGVAKAVSESTGQSSLTSLGVALGTPAYMAPEQAVADPHVDHRADIYAVGALAYEMLCGRPPFVGVNPQAVLSAQVTEAPEPATRHRAAVSAPLNALIMRCLAKKAADRWQRAEELLGQLDAVLTPSGGITPTGTQPVTAVSGATAARHAQPLRVAGLFGLAAVGALAIVYALVQMLGLPDWVVYGAIGLLAVGLPIMLVTGHHERRRAMARTTGMVVPTPAEGVKRWFTWRRSLMGGGLAFTGLALVATLYTAMRLLGIGPVGTLVASGVLEAQDRLIVADFEDRTSEADLATSVTEAFRIDLAQSPVVRLLDASAIGDVLERMNREPGTPLDVSLAREIAEREGAKAVVAGDIGTLGRSYVISVRLLSSADGSELIALRETAGDDASLIDAVDRLSARLRERIGESLKTIRAGEPLARVTTASLEALRLYSRANAALQQGDPERSARLLEEAVGLDTAFAMAYRKLAVVLSNAGAEQSRINAAAARAFAHRDRLPPIERYLATAYYFDQVEPDRARTIEAYRSVLEIDPDDATALNNLAIELNSQRQWEEAEALLRRGIATRPIVQHYVNLMVSLVKQGDSAGVDTALAKFADFEARGPDSPFVAWAHALVSASRRDYTTAEVGFLAVAEAQRGSPAWRRLTNGALIGVEAVQGKLAGAERIAAAEADAAREEGDLGRALEVTARLLRYDLAFHGNPDATMDRLDSALEHYPLAAIAPIDRPYRAVARVYGEAGRPDRAESLREEWETALPPGQRPEFEGYAWDGMIALASGRHQDAIAAYRALYADGRECDVCGLYELARAYDLAGQTDSALAVYERAVRRPALGGELPVNARWLAAAYQRLGELYEERGERERAVEYYSRFVDLWKDADPELQPLVQDVRDRIARLVGER